MKIVTDDRANLGDHMLKQHEVLADENMSVELVQPAVSDIHDHHALQPATVVLKEVQKDKRSDVYSPKSALDASLVVEVFGLADQRHLLH